MMDIRTLTSNLLSRVGIANWAGLTYAGKRDLYAALGYPRTLTAKDYRDRYRRGDIAARIVEALAQATWRGGGELVEDEDPRVLTPFEEAWEALNKRLNIWSTFQRADTLAGIGRYAIVLFGAPGDLAQPLESCPPDQLAYLTPFSEDDAPVQTFELDPVSPRFGLPIMYGLRRAQSGSFQARAVHHTRVLHLADGVIDEPAFGTPRLERIWNRLDDLDKVVGGGAEAFWRRADQGLQVELDPDIKLTPEAQAALADEIDEYVHGLKRVVKTRGVTLNSLGSDVANFGPSVSSIIELISAATGIPQRILLGSERGELASTQDKSNWDERVQDRRDTFASPSVVRPFVDRMIELGVLPEPAEYDVRWPEIEELNETEKVKLGQIAADMNSKMGTTVITVDEIRDHFLGLPPIKEVLPNAPQEAPPPPAPVIVQPGQPPPVPGTPAPVEPPVAASVTSQRTDPTWKAIHRAADQYHARLRKAVLGAFKKAHAAVDAEALRSALDSKDYHAVETLMSPAVETLEGALNDANLDKLFTAIVQAGGKATESFLAKK